MPLVSRRVVLAAGLTPIFSAVQAQGPTPTNAPLSIGVAIPAADHGFTAGIVWWAQQAKKELEQKYPGIKVTLKTAASASEQANQVQDLLTTNKINALVILPQESAALTRPVQQLHNKGVYVTVVDRGLNDESAQDAYVAGDNTAFGRVPAEFIAKQLGGKGEIVALRGIPTTIDKERMDAFTAALKEKGPGIKLLDARHGNWNRDDAFKVMQDFLTRFKHIDAVWASDDDMAVGVLKAIDQAKRTDVKLVFGGAGAKGMVKILKDGSDQRIQANVSYSPKFIRDAIVLTAEARMKGQKLPARTLIPSVLITRANAGDFYFPDSPF